MDQSIESWFPEVPNSNQITIRQLLQHTSGLNDYLDSKKVLDDAQRHWTPDELIMVAVEMGVWSDPGGKYQYSNTNYILLGVIIEKVTGEPWYTQVRSRISAHLLATTPDQGSCSHLTNSYRCLYSCKCRCHDSGADEL